jgi:DNA-binding transcriptional ArsR family regulator
VAKSRSVVRAKSEKVARPEKRPTFRLSPIEAKRLDPVVHERLRLAILSALAVTDALSFTELRSILETSDGNVSVHCRRLEEAEYISVNKSFEGRMPKTKYSITAGGRRALTRYLEAMQEFILSFNRN